MIQVLVALAAGGAVFFLLRAYAEKYRKLLTQNRDALKNGVEQMLKERSPGESDNKKLENYRAIWERIDKAYEEPEQKQRLRMAFYAITALSLIAFLTVLCILYAGGTSLWSLYAVPVLLPGAFLVAAHFRSSQRCGVLASSSVSDPKTWLGVILPSVKLRGEVNLVMGSLDPDYLGEEWFLSALVWLQKKWGVIVRIVSAEPDEKAMTDRHRQKLNDLKSKLGKYDLIRNLHIVPERPLPQYVVTDRVVRIEQDHKSWVNVPSEYLVSNHIHLFDFSLVKSFRRRFQIVWNSSTPAESLPSFRPYTSTNEGIKGNE